MLWMEPFEEQIDSIDAHIRRFERMTIDANWSRSAWALQIYYTLGHHQHSDYDALRISLMKRDGITAAGSRTGAGVA